MPVVCAHSSNGEPQAWTRNNMSHNSPQRIPFNAIDRYYVIPETDDLSGVHFPMSLTITCRLIARPTANQVRIALRCLNERFPQFRLGYTLDAVRQQWLRLPNGDLPAYFDRMVIEDDAPAEELIGDALRANITPLSQPLRIVLHEDCITLHIQHSFGDGRYLATLLGYLLVAIFEPQRLEKLPYLAANYHLPLRAVACGSPART